MSVTTAVVNLPTADRERSQTDFLYLGRDPAIRNRADVPVRDLCSSLSLSLYPCSPGHHLGHMCHIGVHFGKNAATDLVRMDRKEVAEDKATPQAHCGEARVLVRMEDTPLVDSSRIVVGQEVWVV